jgi:ribosomal protein S18 acetylase RimI-like enzyme
MLSITAAGPADAEAILTLQKLAYQSEARLYEDWSIPPLVQSLASLIAEFGDSLVLKALHSGRLVGSVRAKVAADTCHIGRLIVEPAFQGQGIGSRLLREAEGRHPGVVRFQLFTGSRSEANIRLYRRHG